MGWLVDALLLAAVLTEVKTLIPPWTFIALNTNQSGEAIKLITWDWVSSMPSSDFCLSFWIYADTATSDMVDLLNIYFNPSRLEIYWQQVFDLMLWQPNIFASSVVISRDSYAYKPWFHLVLATNGSSLCAIITLRVGTQNQRCTTNPFSLSSTSRIYAPYPLSSSNFIVKFT